jgi:hypothetical protein
LSNKHGYFCSRECGDSGGNPCSSHDKGENLVGRTSWQDEKKEHWRENTLIIRNMTRRCGSSTYGICKFFHCTTWIFHNFFPLKCLRGELGKHYVGTTSVSTFITISRRIRYAKWYTYNIAFQSQARWSRLDLNSNKSHNQGSTTQIAIFHTLLSMASFYCLSHVNFGASLRIIVPPLGFTT